jgi:hypothetical protein
MGGKEGQEVEKHAKWYYIASVSLHSDGVA